MFVPEARDLAKVPEPLNASVHRRQVHINACSRKLCVKLGDGGRLFALAPVEQNQDGIVSPHVAECTSSHLQGATMFDACVAVPGSIHLLGSLRPLPHRSTMVAGAAQV